MPQEDSWPALHSAAGAAPPLRADLQSQWGNGLLAGLQPPAQGGGPGLGWPPQGGGAGGILGAGADDLPPHLSAGFGSPAGPSPAVAAGPPHMAAPWEQHAWQQLGAVGQPVPPQVPGGEPEEEEDHLSLLQVGG